MSFLAIDVGNTRLKWAQYASPQPGAGLLAHGAVFLEQIDHLAETDWEELMPPSTMLGSIVAGEGVKRRVEEQLEIWDIAPRWVVSSPFAAGVSNGYDHPNRLGTDRWVGLIGARHRVLAMGGTPRPALVVMVGTAVTVDAFDKAQFYARDGRNDDDDDFETLKGKIEEAITLGEASKRRRHG